MTTRLDTGGVSIRVPRGWDARLRERPLSTASTSRAALASPAVSLHAGSLALPPTMGDYGSGAVERMTTGDILLCLLEHDPADAEAPLFRREGIPRVQAQDFSADAMQRVIPGMAGAQWFFRVGPRAFCLYGVLGSHRARGSLAPTLASVIDTLSIDPVV